MSDNVQSGWLAFVSDNGHVIGVGRAAPGSDVVERGKVVAILRTPVTLPSWMATLEASRSVDHAVSRALQRHGGERVDREIDLSQATLIPLYTSQIGEA